MKVIIREAPLAHITRRSNFVTVLKSSATKEISLNNMCLSAVSLAHFIL